MEVWKDLNGYEGIYQVSNYGNVKSLGNNKNRKEKILKKSINSVGYYIVTLSINAKSKTRTVHQLVAIVFLDHVPCGYNLIIDHEDLNKLNNHVSNLRIKTQRENCNMKHVPSTSQYVGVHWNKGANKWHVQAKANGVKKYLGLYVNEYDAHLAYENYVKHL